MAASFTLSPSSVAVWVTKKRGAQAASIAQHDRTSALRTCGSVAPRIASSRRAVVLVMPAMEIPAVADAKRDREVVDLGVVEDAGATDVAAVDAEIEVRRQSPQRAAADVPPGGRIA